MLQNVGLSLAIVIGLMPLALFGVLGLAAVTIYVALALARGEAPSEIALRAVALAVATVPEGLPAVLALTDGSVRDLRTSEVTTAIEHDPVLIQTCVSAAAGACRITI